MVSLPSTNMGHPKQQHGDGVHQHPSVTTTSEEYAHAIYRRVAQDQDVEDFLQQTDGFDSESRRWAISPGRTIDGLVNSASRILRSIVGRFATPTRTGVTRTVSTLQPASELEGQQNDQAGSAPSPIAVIQAAGPSFEDPSPPTTNHRSSKPLSNVASYIIPKLDSEVGSVKDVVREMEPYARRIFEQQPNRLFVRCLLLTENHARLLHFDRAGVETTPPINVHQYPDTFVRIIAGLASVNERILGLDDSIQWSIVGGRKDKGTLTTTSPAGQLKAYPILEHIPIPRDGIPGRGTNCWRVQDPDTLEELVVKDSWRPDYLPPEHDLLKLVHDLPGVVQMVSYDTNRAETKDFRCPSTTGKCHNRVAMRTTMKSYGRSIDFFTSALQVLCAIRDAIAGHQRLASDDLKILHRDISHNNILIGTEGVEGHRGVLIDLDAAFRATNECPDVTADFNIGTRIFQSLSVLSTYDMHGPLPAHDYLDDLESFFYILVYTFLIHLPDGSRASSQAAGPLIVSRWDNPNASTAWGHKSRIFSGRDGLIAAKVVEQTWGPACASLYTKFSDWMSDTRHEKLAVLRQKSIEEDGDESDEKYEDSDGEDADEPSDLDPFTLFYSRRDEHYAFVLGLFDEAINEVGADTDSLPAASLVATCASNTAGTIRAGPNPAYAPGSTIATSHPIPLCSPLYHSQDLHVPTVPLPAPQDMEIEQQSPSSNLAQQASIPAVKPPSPLPSAHSSPFPCSIQLRRSARIRDLCRKQNEHSTTAQRGPAPATQVRRSGRITKRRWDQDDHVAATPPKVKRMKGAPSIANGVY